MHVNSSETPWATACQEYLSHITGATCDLVCVVGLLLPARPENKIFQRPVLWLQPAQPLGRWVNLEPCVVVQVQEWVEDTHHLPGRWGSDILDILGMIFRVHLPPLNCIMDNFKSEWLQQRPPYILQTEAYFPNSKSKEASHSKSRDIQLETCHNWSKKGSSAKSSRAYQSVHIHFLLDMAEGLFSF